MADEPGLLHTVKHDVSSQDSIVCAEREDKQPEWRTRKKQIRKGLRPVKGGGEAVRSLERR